MRGDDLQTAVERWSVAALGVALLALTLSNFVATDQPVVVRLAATSLPLAFAVAVGALGLVLARGADPDRTVRVCFWALVGQAGAFAVAGWIAAVQSMHGVDLTDLNHVLLSCAAFGAAGGTVFGLYHDRLRTRELELAAKNERLDEFASVLSHDLRNPLNVARGSFDLYRETGDPEHAEAVQRSQRRMERIVDDVLAMARAGSDVAERESISLASLARDAWATVETGGAALSVETDRVVTGDRTRLRSVFENLYRNAVEHGSGDRNGHDGASVTVTVGDLADGDGFYVEDDGPGIPPDRREEVFTSGYTGEGGTGLGLALVRRIAEAHGWSVTAAESDEGGARFEFRDQ